MWFTEISCVRYYTNNKNHGKPDTSGHLYGGQGSGLGSGQSGGQLQRHVY